MNYRELTIGLFIATIFTACGGGSSSSHHQGQACLNCHGKDVQNSAPILSTAGTIYTLKTAIDGIDDIASGHNMQFLMSDASTISFRKGKGDGNINLKNLDKSGKFTAQVLDTDGNIVNQSNTDSHDTATHLNCNSCHTATSTQGRITN